MAKKRAESATRPLALVTGASSGVGLELARVFSQNGYDLLIAAEDPGIHEAKAELPKPGALVDSVQVDLATHDGVDSPPPSRPSCPRRWRPSTAARRPSSARSRTRSATS